ncbi:MAG: energy-coupling factor transporter transmembrane protein EcfT [Oscillospiraceae bacterium]|jgi:energy-coupling factor transporter transmembrane protein EcfT|nr:energy-coupling factor transporter transmembrane protein EcfT [Oscillospiraceae bacterium]
MRSLNPAFKLIGLLAVTFLLAARHDPLLSLSAFVISLIAMLVSRVRLKAMLLLFLPVFLAAAGMFFTGYRFAAGNSMPVRAEILHIGSSAVWNGLTLSSRVLAYAGLGLLFALTTDRIELIRSFQKQLHVPAIFAYGLLAAWGIFPHMALEYRRTRAAFRARGIHVFPMSPSLLNPLLVKSVRWSEELAIAMESKGFDGRTTRSEFAPVLVRTSDWVFLAVCCLGLPAAVFFL